MEASHWNVKEIPEGMTGFVYQITNCKTGKKYIGKKLYYSTRHLKPLKGKKRRRKVVTESDWKTYCSSSDIVKKDIEVFGKENFLFEILKSFKNKSYLNYHEIELQVKNDVLRNDQWYNANILCKFYKHKV